MNHFYLAVFHKNGDGSYTVIFPDLPGCVSEGKNLTQAMKASGQALSQWIGYLSDKKLELPAPTPVEDYPHEKGEFLVLISAEVAAERAVRRTVSIPKWMDDGAAKAGLSLSRILQEDLKERLSN